MTVEQDPTNGNNDLGSAGRQADEPTDPTMPQVTPDGSSRRNFLKAAVVASAAVAAAGGAAGVALVSGRSPSPLVKFIGNVNSGDPCDACIEGTTYTSEPRTYLTTNMPATSSQLSSLGVGFTVNSQGNAAGDFELFFVDHAPAAGSINVTISVTGTSVSKSDSGTDIDSSTLFNFPPGNGNHAFVTEQTNVPSAPCMSDQSTNLASFVKNLGTSPASNFSGTGFGTAGPVTYSPVTSSDDVLVQLHLVWNGGLISNTTNDTQIYTFQFSWTDSGGTSCNKYLYIKGQQN